MPKHGRPNRGTLPIPPIPFPSRPGKKIAQWIALRKNWGKTKRYHFGRMVCSVSFLRGAAVQLVYRVIPVRGSSPGLSNALKFWTAAFAAVTL